MTLGDRVAVMRAGVVQQVDAPKTLYERPANLFVAGFIGSPAMNFLPGQVEGHTLHTPIGDTPLPGELKAGLNGGGEVIIGVRPEHFEDPAATGRDVPGMRFRAKIAVVESMGSELYAYFDIDTAAQSAELAELARDAGLDEVPSHGATQVVARLDAASRARAGA